MTELLGRTVRDRVSGLTGIADQYVEMVSGTRQYSVQPQGDGKTVPDGFNVDVQRLEIVEDGPCVTPDPIDASVQVKLGDKVESVITGHIGIATQKNTYINGCVYFNVTGHKNAPMHKEDSGTLFTSHRTLKVLKPDEFARLTADMAPVAPVAAKPPPGGPVTRSLRAC